MKHIFIINPTAGKGSPAEPLKKELNSRNDFDWEIYETKGPKDATRYVKERCTNEPDQELRFYACGGDGTLNEVVNGAIGFDNASLTAWACGTGNDYVKVFGGPEQFLDLDKLLNGKERKVDVMKISGDNIDDFYAINVINFGFDTVVGRTMNEIKTKPIIGGKHAYTSAIVKALFTAMKNVCTVYADGEKMTGDKYLMTTIACGQYVGGQFQCAPKSIVDDGLAEVCVIDTIRIWRFPTLIGPYANGEHLDNAKFDGIVHYKRASKITIEHPENQEICVDGEMVTSKHFEIECLEKKIRFVVPE